jgi:hypothetical protein
MMSPFSWDGGGATADVRRQNRLVWTSAHNAHVVEIKIKKQRYKHLDNYPNQSFLTTKCKTCREKQTVRDKKLILSDSTQKMCLTGLHV